MILWFSGTGNSRYVAERLGERLQQDLVRLTPDIASSPIHLSSDDSMVIWVFPVYSWGVPPFVRNLIRNIKFSPETNVGNFVHHLVMTCGDDCGLAPEMWRKEIRSRTWADGNVFTVIMPNNYVCMKGFDVDPLALQEEKLTQAPTRLDTICKIIKDNPSGQITDVTRGKFAWIKTRIIYPWFVRHAMSPRPFHVTSACISCGKCASACPLDNVRLIESKPAWGNNCAGCLACYHVCPRHAVMYGHATEHKGQYLNPTFHN